MKRILTPKDVFELCADIAVTINRTFPYPFGDAARNQFQLPLAYAIPRGGIPAMYAAMSIGAQFHIADTPEEADFFIDDIIDSGSTMEEWCDRYPGKPFFALIDKTDSSHAWKDDWIVFPWEAEGVRSADDSIVGTITNRIKNSNSKFFANDNISDHIKSPLEFQMLQDEVESRAEHLLRGLIIDIDNDHNTQGTAKRLAKMYLHEIFKGRYYGPPVLTDFPNIKHLDEMYMSGPISVRSMCSHHMVPIIGRCWVGVVPGDRLIGLSKFNRIVQWIASRPQIQEEMVVAIADHLQAELQPLGLAVVVEATHMCMTLRGVKEPMDARMTTNVMRGVFREKPEARAEFMTLVAKG